MPVFESRNVLYYGNNSDWITLGYVIFSVTVLFRFTIYYSMFAFYRLIII